MRIHLKDSKSPSSLKGLPVLLAKSQASHLHTYRKLNIYFRTVKKRGLFRLTENNTYFIPLSQGFHNNNIFEGQRKTPKNGSNNDSTIKMKNIIFHN